MIHLVQNGTGLDIVRGSIHCHGTVKLNNDPGLSTYSNCFERFFSTKM